MNLLAAYIFAWTEKLYENLHLEYLRHFRFKLLRE